MFETLKGRIPKSIDEDEYRKFAVMVALLKQEDGLHVVFEKRAGGLFIRCHYLDFCRDGHLRHSQSSFLCYFTNTIIQL